jgi:hypothetical protein
MTFKKLLPMTALMCFSGAASASVIAGNSNYGGTMGVVAATCPSSLPTPPYTFALSCNADGATIMSEAFASSSPVTTDDVVDFEVTGLSNYTLTLTETGAPFDPDTVLGIDDGYGLFQCSNPPQEPQCSNPSSNGSFSLVTNQGTLNTANGTVAFGVTGATASDTFVFFALVTAPSASADASVTATIAPAVAAVPEPRAFPMFGFGLLALAVFRLRIVSPIRWLRHATADADARPEGESDFSHPTGPADGTCL